MIMSNVVQFNGMTTKALEPDVIMDDLKGTLTSLLWIGRDKDGQVSAGCSEGDAGEALVLLELGKRIIMDCIE
jgi:hypothetical protein